MGNYDERRKSQFNPMNLPPSRRSVPEGDAPDPSPSSSPASSRSGSDGGNRSQSAGSRAGSAGSSRSGSGGGQFRSPLPHFGPQRREEGSVEIDAFRARDRFRARHGDRDRSVPVREGYVPPPSYPAYEEPAWDDNRYDDPYEDGGRDGDDPWARDWGAWSSPYLPDEGFDEDEELMGGNWRRDAWGALPNGYTMASVAIEVALPSSRRPTPSAKGPAFGQIMRWVRSGFAGAERPTKRAMRLLLVTSILGVIVLSGLGAGLYAYNDYRVLYAEAKDATDALQHIGDDLGLGKNAPKTPPTAAQTQAALNADLTRALNDFQDLRSRLQNPDFVLQLAGKIPTVRDKLASGLVLTSIGIDAVHMLQATSATIASLANLLRASPIATSSADTTPLLDVDGLKSLSRALDEVQPIVMHMVQTINDTPPDILIAALSAKQQRDVVPLLQGVPELPTLLSIASAFLSLPSAANLLGITKPVAYLIMTLDNTEIRPIGGFQGQYAVVGVNGAHVEHISLEDVYNVLEPLIASNDQQGQVYQSYPGLTIPQEGWYGTYASLGWAMRNSGLSPDFTQSARYALWYLHNENLCQWTNKATPPGHFRYFCDCTHYSLSNIVTFPNYTCLPGGDHVPVVDTNGAITGYGQKQAPMAGVITIQVRVIAQLLSVIGPIKVGCPYNDTVTADNLQDKIHFYQETDEGRQKGTGTCGSQPGLSDSTKRFTALLAQALQAKLKSIPKADLFKFAGDLITDLHTKDIQIYFTDPTAPQSGAVVGPNAWTNDPDPSQIYPPDQAAEAFLEKYQISSEMYPNLAVQDKIAGQQSPALDDSLVMNRADIVGWKMERFVKLHLIDHISIGPAPDYVVTHTFQAQDDFSAIPPIPVAKNADGSIDQATTNTNIFNQVYNAKNLNAYEEYWRLYTNPTASLMQNSTVQQGDPIRDFGPITSADGADINDQAYFQGLVYYFWDDTQGDTVQWSYHGQGSNGVTYDDEPPNMVWTTTNVVHNGLYDLHMQPQSGVNTSIDIEITGPCGTTKTVQGALTSNTVIQFPIGQC